MHDTFDRALDRLHGTDLEFGSGSLDGLSNHGPMAAEALVTLGHADRVDAFLDAYVERLRARPPGTPITDRAAALGDVTRAGDWIATYERELAERPWRDVLREAVPALSAGVLASALHGWLRVAHAVRSLERADTPSRRRELAHGLALWAARYQELPGDPGARPAPGRDAAAVLARVPRLDVPRRGLIFDRLKVVATDPRFAAAIDSWDPSTFELDGFVRGAAAIGAAGVIGVPGSRIALVHVVTGASALRIVAPHLDDAATRRLAGHLLQVVASVDAVYGEPVALDDAPAPEPEPEALRALAGRSRDDHGIKLAEAALREHAIAPAPTLLRAAATLLR